MQISRYGITLSRLTAADIELVRINRNASHVSEFMEYREHITEEMQLAWFEKINTAEHYFFLIEAACKKVGLISTFDINWQQKRAKCGIFVWDQNVLVRRSLMQSLQSKNTVYLSDWRACLATVCTQVYSVYWTYEWMTC